MVHCLKSEYDAFMEGVSAEEPDPVEQIFTAPSAKDPVGGSSDRGERKIHIKLSPTTHRPTGNKDQRVTIGVRGCGKLALFINCKDMILEHEEDRIEDEG